MIILPFVLVVWVVYGLVNAHSATSTTPAAPAPCADCAALRAWYAGLHSWGQLLNAPGYYLRLAICLVRGC